MISKDFGPIIQCRVCVANFFHKFWYIILSICIKNRRYNKVSHLMSLFL